MFVYMCTFQEHKLKKKPDITIKFQTLKREQSPRPKEKQIFFFFNHKKALRKYRVLCFSFSLHLTGFFKRFHSETVYSIVRLTGLLLNKRSDLRMIKERE